MNTLRIISTILVFSSCNRLGDPAPTELIGSWVLSAASSDKVPYECRNVSLEFTRDGHFVSTSGELTFVTKISITKQNKGFLVHQTFTEHNGKPNCQGKPAEYLVSHLAPDIYFERDGTVLRQYIWTKESGRFIEFVQSPST